MRKRNFSLLLTLLAFALVLVACAPVTPSEAISSAAAGASMAASEAAASVATAQDVAENSAENIDETVVTAFEDLQQAPALDDTSSAASLDIWADETRAPVLQEIAAAFETATGVPMVVTELPFDQIRPAFEEAAAAGQGPDIIVGSFGWVGELTERELLATLDLGAKRDEFLESAVKAFEVDGELYGMPYATENLALVYNPELVSEPPATWSELATLAAQLEADGVVDQGFVRQTGDPYHFYPILSAFGGYIFGRDAEGDYDATDLGITTAGAEAAFQWLADRVAADNLDPNAIVDYDVMHGLFESGDAAMIVTGPWALPRLRASGIPFVVTELPGEAQAATPFIGVQGFMLSALSENPEAAARFLVDFVATDEVMQEIFKGDPRPSAYLPVREVIEDPDLFGFALAGENGVPEPNVPAMSAVWEALDSALQQITRGELAVDEALSQAAEQIETSISAEME